MLLCVRKHYKLNELNAYTRDIRLSVQFKHRMYLILSQNLNIIQEQRSRKAFWGYNLRNLLKTVTNPYIKLLYFHFLYVICNLGKKKISL